jgi:DEAD/DEAH box helicase domain-containing protein
LGLSARVWELHDQLSGGAAELIRDCGCESGCPACTGPRLEPDLDAKALALRLLAELGGSDTASALQPDLVPA